MQNVSENYLTILSGLYDVESKLEVYTRDGSQLVATFDGDEIVSLSTHRKLFPENHPSIGGAVANEIDASFYVGDAEIPKMAMLKPWSRLTEISNKYEVDANGEDVWVWSEINLSGVYADIYDYVVFDGDVVVPVGEGTRLAYVDGGTNTHDITDKYLKIGGGEFYKAEGFLTFNSRTSMWGPGGKGLTKSDRKYNNVSEWVQKGVFWVDTRKKDYETSVLTIHGFDGILQLERMNTLNSTSSATLLNHICTTLGFQLDNRTQAASVTVSNPTYYTFREIMQMIAAVSAGNWIMTDLGELLLVPLNGMPTETYVLVDNIGNAITFGGDRILTEVV